nr:pre-mRNA-splicing factor cwc-21-like [Odocoileus virginianus texanus]
MGGGGKELVLMEVPEDRAGERQDTRSPGPPARARGRARAGPRAPGPAGRSLCGVWGGPRGSARGRREREGRERGREAGRAQCSGGRGDGGGREADGRAAAGRRGEASAGQRRQRSRSRSGAGPGRARTSGSGSGSISLAEPAQASLECGLRTAQETELNFVTQPPEAARHGPHFPNPDAFHLTRRRGWDENTETQKEVATSQELGDPGCNSEILSSLPTYPTQPAPRKMRESRAKQGEEETGRRATCLCPQPLEITQISRLTEVLFLAQALWDQPDCFQTHYIIVHIFI